LVNLNYFNQILNSKNLHQWFANFIQSRIGLTPHIQFIDNEFHLKFFYNKLSYTIIFTSNGRNSFFDKKNKYVCFLNKNDFNSHGCKNYFTEPGLVLYGVNSLDWFSQKNSKNSILINYDFVSYSVWTLNRIEEYGNLSDEKHGRYELSKSHLKYCDIYLRPIVDEWLVFISKILITEGFEIRSTKFDISISHDIDIVSRYQSVPLPHLIFKLLKDFISNRALVKSYFDDKNNFVQNEHSFSFNWLMENSNRIGTKSKFYFIPNNTSFLYDYRYLIRSKLIKNILLNIRDNGHEIGIHYSYNASKKKLINKEWSDFNKFCNEINVTISGGRMHYLRFSFLETLRQLATAGQKYDNTITFHEVGGFRTGTCIKFKPFDIFHLTEIDIFIHPLIIMDDSILTYMDFESSENTFQYIRKIIDSCKNVGGTFSLLWHNSNLDKSYKIDLYLQVLNYCDKLLNEQQEL
jgi:hypothetical protein